MCSSDLNNDVLDQGLSYRQSKIQTTRDYLQRTQALFDLFGSNELKTSHAKFAELAKALESDSQVLLVVIGEFSRGKSSLVNALLGIHLLRSAQEATTAINTFIKALPADRTERFIRIHFQDGRPHQEIPWTDESVLSVGERSWTQAMPMRVKRLIILRYLHHTPCSKKAWC